MQIKVKLPGAFLNSRHTAVRVADIAVAAAGIVNPDAAIMEAAINSAHATDRYNAHMDAIEAVRATGADHECAFTNVPLPIACNPDVTTRDDYGIPGRLNGIDIGLYQNTNQDLAANNMNVWMLHVELTGKERVRNTPIRPDGQHRNYTNFA